MWKDVRKHHTDYQNDTHPLHAYLDALAPVRSLADIRCITPELAAAFELRTLLEHRELGETRLRPSKPVIHVTTRGFSLYLQTQGRGA